MWGIGSHQCWKFLTTFLFMLHNLETISDAMFFIGFNRIAFYSEISNLEIIMNILIHNLCFNLVISNTHTFKITIGELSSRWVTALFVNNHVSEYISLYVNVQLRKLASDYLCLLAEKSFSFLITSTTNFRS
jgi:hypothetical protein